MQLADSSPRISMVNYNNRLFCRLDPDLTPAAREQERLTVLKTLGLLDTEMVPVFDEAIQTAANYLKAPVGFLGLAIQDKLWLKAAVGLSSIGLMNQLAVSRQLPRSDSFCTYVVDSENCLVINDTISNSAFANSVLVQHYGIRAYLGAPLITGDGHCLGTIAIMDLEPRDFSKKDVEFLAMTARWCFSEFERNRLLTKQPVASLPTKFSPSLPSAYGKPSQQPEVLTGEIEERGFEGAYPRSQDSYPSGIPNSTDSIKVKLLSHLTQELRTPLTSVMGMARVLSREVYGPLTGKQKEYLEVIHNSGQHLLTLVEEIVNLDVLDQDSQRLNLAPLDIEMLCQQAVNSLQQIAQEQKQELRLSVEPGNRIWLLDKDKVRQAVYYLIVSVIETAEPGSEVRVHVSRKLADFSTNVPTLNMAVWVSHPWLGDGLPQVNPYSSPLLTESVGIPSFGIATENDRKIIDKASLAKALLESNQTESTSTGNRSRELLGLLLSCHLTEMHGGSISVQGSHQSGYRYILSLPQISSEEGI